VPDEITLTEIAKQLKIQGFTKHHCKMKEPVARSSEDLNIISMR